MNRREVCILSFVAFFETLSRKATVLFDLLLQLLRMYVIESFTINTLFGCYGLVLRHVACFLLRPNIWGYIYLN